MLSGARFRACMAQSFSLMQSAVYGNFSGPKAQEIIVSRGKVLELLRPDENGKMQTICSTEVFGTIRAIMPFRLTDVGRTYIVMGTDSGRIVILEYSKVTQFLSQNLIFAWPWDRVLKKEDRIATFQCNLDKLMTDIHSNIVPKVYVITGDGSCLRQSASSTSAYRKRITSRRCTKKPLENRDADGLSLDSI